MLRILALSDVTAWTGQRELIDKYRPQVVALAGDLTSDGAARFWRTAFEAIPAFRRERRERLRQLGIRTRVDRGFTIVTGGSLRDVMTVEYELKSRYRHTDAFRRARERLHVRKFYSFLRYAGRKAAVLVVRGDHDDDFPGDYDPVRITAIRGCQEISGKTASVGGVTFLGLGFDECVILGPLREMVRRMAGATDVVICHPPHRNVRAVAELKPRLLIRGHFGGGRFLVDGVPTVFTSWGAAVIDLPHRGLPRIRSLAHGERFLSDRYDWLTPYDKLGHAARLRPSLHRPPN